MRARLRSASSTGRAEHARLGSRGSRHVTPSHRGAAAQLSRRRATPTRRVRSAGPLVGTFTLWITATPGRTPASSGSTVAAIDSRRRGQPPDDAAPATRRGALSVVHDPQPSVTAARLTEPVANGMMTDGVAYAEPPATVPSTVSHRRQRDQRLRSLSQPDRLGRGCWGTVAQGVEGRDDSPQELQAPGTRPRRQDRRVLHVCPPALPSDSIRRRHVGSKEPQERTARRRADPRS